MDFKVFYNKDKASIIASFKQDYIDEFIQKADNDKIIDMVFVIDKSGSMEDRFIPNKYNYKTSLQSKSQVVLSALSQSVEYLKILSKHNHKIRLSIISFDENANLLLDKVLVEDSSVFNIRFNDIKYNLRPNGGTDIFKALQFTKSHVDTILQTNSNIENINIFIMTDGYNNDKNNSVSMVEFFKSITYYNRFTGMGIGNATDYDAELLDRLFIKLKTSPSASELSDNISSDTFGACSTALTNFKIVFEDYGNSEFYTPMNFEKKDDTIVVSLDKVDFSQKLIFSFDNKDEFSTPIKMKISYKNCIENKLELYETILNTGEINDSINNKINILTHNISDFIKISNSSLSYKDNLDKTKDLLDKFSSWNKEDRFGDIGDIWTANETIVFNHKNELDKYADLQSYVAYSKVHSKQLETTISIGLTPELSRQISDNVYTKYSGGEIISNEKSLNNHIPEDIDYDESFNANYFAPQETNNFFRQNTLDLPNLITPVRELSPYDTPSPLDTHSPFSPRKKIPIVPKKNSISETLDSVAKNLSYEFDSPSKF